MGMWEVRVISLLVLFHDVSTGEEAGVRERRCWRRQKMGEQGGGGKRRSESPQQCMLPKPSLTLFTSYLIFSQPAPKFSHLTSHTFLILATLPQGVAALLLPYTSTTTLLQVLGEARGGPQLASATHCHICPCH